MPTTTQRINGLVNEATDMAREAAVRAKQGGPKAAAAMVDASEVLLDAAGFVASLAAEGIDLGGD